MAWFQRLNGPEAGKSYALRDGDLLGVGGECMLSFAPYEPSRLFARMRIEGRECWLEVLIPHSMRLNGAAGDLLELYDGAVVELSEREDRLRFSLQAPPEWGVPLSAQLKPSLNRLNMPPAPLATCAPVPHHGPEPHAPEPRSPVHHGPEPRAPEPRVVQPPPEPALQRTPTMPAPPPLYVPETTVTARTGGVPTPGPSPYPPSLAFPPQPTHGWAEPLLSRVPLEPTPPLPLSEALPPLDSSWRSEGLSFPLSPQAGSAAPNTLPQSQGMRETLALSSAPPRLTERAKEVEPASPSQLSIEALDFAYGDAPSPKQKLNMPVLAFGLLAVAGLVVMAFVWT